LIAAIKIAVKKLCRLQNNVRFISVWFPIFQNFMWIKFALCG